MSGASRLATEPVQQSSALLQSIGDPQDPQLVMVGDDQVCSDWEELLDKLNARTTAWQSLDPSIPASQWSPEQRKAVDETISPFNDFADEALKLAQQTKNPVLADLMTFSAQYRRAYAAALTSYIPTDSYLASAGGAAASTIYNSCKLLRG